VGHPGGVRGVRAAPVAVAVACAALAAGGCGEKEEPRHGAEPEQFDLALDFYVNPDHVGIYQTLERGYFEQAGLDVRPRVPSDPAAPIKQVAAGQVDLAISYEPEVLLARDEGLEVVAVGALVQEPLTSLISLGDEGIRGVEDLEGKTIATAGIPYQTAFLEAILERAGLTPDDVSQVDVGLNLLPAVLSGRANAMLGGFANVEGVDLRLRGEDPRVVPVNRLGIPTYDELVLVASEEQVADDPEPIRLFIAALEKGTRDAVEDPDGATAALLDAAPDLDPKLTSAEVEATLPVLESESRDPYGYMNPEQWQRFAGFMADEGQIDALPQATEVLTNDLLPGGLSE
jgi:putative hydroxymethylpyrimidine transport system substrate-binding protein